MRATTGCGARRSSSLRTKSRRRRPCRSSQWISLAMNVSDRRGKPVSRYAIEPVARLALRRASAIGPLEHPAEPLGAAPELETSLDVRPPLPPQPLPPVRPGPFADDPQPERDREARDRLDERLEALFLDQPAHREEAERDPARLRPGAEAMRVHPVREDARRRPCPRQLGGDVAVAGDDTGRPPGARGECRRRDFPGITCMDAEAVRHAEPPRGVRRDRGGAVREVAVDACYLPSAKALGETRRLRARAPRGEQLDSAEEARAAGVERPAVTCLGREHGGEGAARVEGEQLVQQEGLRPARKAAGDHGDAAGHHAPPSNSARARVTTRTSPPRSTGSTGAGYRRRADSTVEISRSGVSSPGSMRSKYPRSAKRRARMSCSRTGSARGTGTARRPEERSSHTVLYPAIETTTSASA